MKTPQGLKSINAVLKACSDLLRPKFDTHALEARVLVGHVLDMSAEELIMHGEREVAKNLRDEIFTLIERRIKGTPLAYLTGEKEFYGRSFFVNADVLIPRAETEIVVEQALLCAKATPQTILDIGTGSGCIGITLAAELSGDSQARGNFKVLLADTCPRALRLAEKNAEKILGTEGVENHVRLCRWDVREPLKKMQPYMRNEKLMLDDIEIVVANLPYVAAHEYEYARENLKYEPRLALVGSSGGHGSDGFFFIERLLQVTAQFEHAHSLVLECDPLHIDRIVRKGAQSGYAAMRISHDLRGYPRVCVLFSDGG